MKSRNTKTNQLTYTISEHQHRFAAWAASRAASVKGCRFTVKQGQTILETCGFNSDLFDPEQLPSPKYMMRTHREWRQKVIKTAKSQGKKFTHGVAAKLINCYLKSRFVCANHHSHERVKYLHPPIDAVLLKALSSTKSGKYADEWREIRKIPWSRFNSTQYENVIGLIKKSIVGEPLWMIEEYWKGNR